MKTKNIAMQKILEEAKVEMAKFNDDTKVLAALINGEDNDLSFRLFSKAELDEHKIKCIQLVREYLPLWLISTEENNTYIFLKNDNGVIASITLEDIPHCVNYSRI